jgi:4-diphosphocytidyl-2C-methyl-D-erythritol kinase
MNTLEQNQAETLSDDVKRMVTAEQFAEDWLLVAENDFSTYSEVMSKAEQFPEVAKLSDSLRQEWEELAQQVTETVEENISPEASLFIAQMLSGTGSLPFDIIARRLLVNVQESK